MSVNYKAQYSCFRCPVELKAVNMSLIDEADLFFFQRAHVMRKLYSKKQEEGNKPEFF